MYSIEMAAKQISTRMICVEAGKPIRKLAERANLPAIKAAQHQFRKLNFSIDDTNAIDVNILVARTLDYHRRNPLALVLVDYIQIIKVAGGRSKAEEVNLVCEKLKGLANTINCPVLAVAQMNRQFDSRVTEDPSARPVMSDLADSAGIEKWADMIACLHRPDPDRVRVFVLKNRHGESQDFDLKFSGEQTKFYDHEEVL
jgi:replicative DNA helicase